jgi:ABC-type lipoprotein export system ATPase subunit
MVTHDLRMIGYVDKIISMIDGRIDLITDDCSVIESMAGTIPPPTQIKTGATPSGIAQT